MPLRPDDGALETKISLLSCSRPLVKERRVTGRKFRYLLTDIRLRFGRLPQVALPLNYWQRSAFKAFLLDSNSAQSLLS